MENGQVRSMKKLLKNAWFVSGVGLVFLGITLVSAYCLRTPASEITRGELEQLIAAKGISEGSVTPTPYSGIYQVEGVRNSGGKSGKFYVTTHLDEGQVKALFAERGIKVDMPGQGARGQWVSIVSTVLIAGLVIMMVVYQTNIGRG